MITSTNPTASRTPHTFAVLVALAAIAGCAAPHSDAGGDEPESLASTSSELRCSSTPTDTLNMAWAPSSSSSEEDPSQVSACSYLVGVTIGQGTPGSPLTLRLGSVPQQIPTTAQSCAGTLFSGRIERSVDGEWVTVAQSSSNGVWVDGACKIGVSALSFPSLAAQFRIYGRASKLSFYGGSPTTIYLPMKATAIVY